MRLINIDKDKAYSYDIHKNDPSNFESIDSLKQFLNCEVTITEGTTFWDVWKYITFDVKYFNTVFSDALGYHDLSLYVDQGMKNGSEIDEDKKHKMQYLQAEWDVDIHEGVLRISTDFGGIGPQKSLISGKEYVGKYAIEFMPVNDLMRYPLKLNEELEINGKKIKKPWTVYDMYYAILFEISFLGTPNEQISKLADFDQIIAAAKDELRYNDKD